MDLCDSGHEQVCYDSKRCPVCEVKAELADVEGALIQTKSEVEDLKTKLSEAEGWVS